MANFINRTLFRAASNGTGSFVVDTAVTGYMTPAQADAVNATVYSYFAESDDKAEWEIGTGTYTTGDVTLTRTALKSSNANNTVNFTAAPKVGMTALAADIMSYSANLAEWSGINPSANGGSLVAAADYAAMKVLLDLEVGVDFNAYSSLIAAIAALTPTDGNIIVGDGSTWVAESGSTARTSLGLGTGNAPQFTAINIGNATDTTISRASAGDVQVEGNLLYRAGGTDVPLADGGTGASLADPNADRIMFWDDSAGAVTWLSLGTGLAFNVTALELDADLQSWAGVTRASGFDTFAATPSSANLRAMLTDEDGTGPALFGGSSYIREKLTANRTYYVRTDGSDSNTGLVNNAGGAFLTLQKAFDTMATLDGNGYSVTIQQGTAGTLTGSFNANKYLIGIASVVLDLGGGTLSTTSATAVTIQRPMHITVQNGTLQTTTDGSGIRASGAGVNVTLGSSVTFGACASAHILVRDGAKLTISNAYTISGNAPHHYQIEFSGILEMANFTVTVSGTPAFANSFAFTYMGGIVSAYSVSYSGAATGKRYDVTIGGLINVFGGGVNYFPGNSVGTVSPDAIGYG